MSDVVSALNHKSFDGYVLIEEQGLQGMLTLRGDLSDKTVIKAVTSLTGVEMPGQRAVVLEAGKGLAWMSPDELLVLLPYDEAEVGLTFLNAALSGQHALVVNVSDARVVLRIQGTGAAEVIAKLAPVDLSQGAFALGEVRRTRIAQVPAAFWRSGEEAFTLVAFRSVAGYVFDLLKSSAMPGGEVGYF